MDSKICFTSFIVNEQNRALCDLHPHTKHPSVENLVATVALSNDGVDFASLDGEVVHILFLLVSPPDRPGDHLRGLENISRHLRNQNFCSFLKQATSTNDVVELLQEADNEQLDS